MITNNETTLSSLFLEQPTFHFLSRYLQAKIKRITAIHLYTLYSIHFLVDVFTFICSVRLILFLCVCGSSLSDGANFTFTRTDLHLHNDNRYIPAKIHRLIGSTDNRKPHTLTHTPRIHILLEHTINTTITPTNEE